jgi:hypothetical protein
MLTNSPWSRLLLTFWNPSDVPQQIETVSGAGHGTTIHSSARQHILPALSQYNNSHQLQHQQYY